LENETLLKIELEGSPRQNAASVLSYLWKALHRDAIDLAESESHRKDREDTYLVRNPSHVEGMSAIELRIDLQRVLDQLPKKHAEILSKWAVEEYTIRELAEEFDVPRSTLDRWLIKARKLLATLFGKEDQKEQEEDSQVIIKIRLSCKYLRIERKRSERKK
jgi:RNA polymerase sigma factor (sigma-70 family)